MSQTDLIVADLRALDARGGDALVLGVLLDERPLQGLAGLVDWRLRGALSRWLVSGFASGAWGERVIYPSVDRLGQATTLVLGLGTRPQLRTDRVHDAARAAAEVVTGLGATDITCDLLGLDRLPTPLENTLPDLLDVFRSCKGLTRITLAVDPDRFEAVQAIMDSFGRRGFAPNA
jgi:hypothetical protein